MEDSAHVPPPIPDSSLIDSIDLHVEPVSLSLCLSVCFCLSVFISIAVHSIELNSMKVNERHMCALRVYV